jgi:guanine deaminase
LIFLIIFMDREDEKMKTIKENFMYLAIREASKGVQQDHGGPFGAIIVRQGVVIARAHNQVLKNNDPTAHAEVMAIRRAAKKLQSFNLSDCEIYTTCEPCPMCFAAMYWARIPTMYYGCTRHDAARIGFDDNRIYQVLKGQSPQQQLKIYSLDHEACLKLFDQWQEKADRRMY